MKKLLSLVLVITILCSVALFGSAQQYSAVSSTAKIQHISMDELWKYTVSEDDTVEVTAYLGSNTSVSVPSVIDLRAVSSIGKTAFINGEFSEVTLPDSVKQIGWWAFYNCKNLKTVNLGSSLSTIGYGAFINCSKLMSVKLPASVTKIETDAFARNCVTNKNVYDSASEQTVSTQNYMTNNLFVLYGYSGTTAEKYAKNTSIKFKSLGTVLYGDANGDGKINSYDITAVAKIINDGNATALLKANADVDGDGTVTEADVQYISEYIDNRISYYSFPAAKQLKTFDAYLDGKSIYCDGDSVAKGEGTEILGSDYHSYCNDIAEKYNMTLTQCARRGTAIARIPSKTKESNRSILERVLEMSGNYDVILLEGGFNDLFQGLDIGTLTPDSDRSGNYNEYTTVGALESICYFITKNYPDAVKLFVLCQSRTENTDQYKYWDAIISVLNKWGIEYVDISEETQLSDSNSDIAAQYFKYESDKDSGDGTHPLKYVHQTVYTPLIEDKLNQMYEDKIKSELNTTSIDMGLTEQYQLTASLSDNSVISDFTWLSDDSSIASVDADGTVTAKKPGTAIIRVCSEDSQTAVCRVTVKCRALELKLNKTLAMLFVGETLDIDSTVFQGTAAWNRTYTSSDPSVAVVETYGGKVTACGTGTAVITCTTFNGLSAECTVTVK